MKNQTSKKISVFSCFLVLLSIFYVSASAAVKTTTSGVHVRQQIGKDGTITMVQIKDPGPQITIDETEMVCNMDPSQWITWHNGTVTKTISIQFQGMASKVDTVNKCIYVNFGGDTGDTQKLKDLGVKLLNPVGAEIYYWDAGRCTLKIPYSDISFVKEMYITYGDQKVKMTVA